MNSKIFTHLKIYALPIWKNDLCKAALVSVRVSQNISASVETECFDGFYSPSVSVYETFGRCQANVNILYPRNERLPLSPQKNNSDIFWKHFRNDLDYILYLFEQWEYLHTENFLPFILENTSLHYIQSSELHAQTT
jgi:hypothetical protein